MRPTSTRTGIASLICAAILAGCGSGSDSNGDGSQAPAPAPAPTPNPEPGPAPAPPPEPGPGPAPAPAPGPAGTGAECLNPETWQNGTVMTLNMQTMTAGGVAPRTVNLRITAPVTFQGQSAIEAEATAFGLTGQTYIQQQGTRETVYGSVSQVTTGGTATTVNTPALVMDSGLLPGQSETATYTATTSYAGTPAPIPTSAITYTQVRRFEGFETVTVPAGTFADACKWTYEISTSAPPSTTVSTLWMSRGTGITVRILSLGSDDVLVSGTINGKPIVP